MSSTPFVTSTSNQFVDPGPRLIGVDANDLVGFHGATPTDQYALITSVATTGASSSSPFGFTTSAQANALVTAVNQIILLLREKGLSASS